MHQSATYEIWKNPFSSAAKDISPDAEQYLLENSESNSMSFVAGPYGFFAFEPSINLLKALTEHTKNTAIQSCGKCTPCRAGLKLMVEKLNKLLEEGGAEADLQDLLQLSEHVSRTSLCGLGQTALIPLYNAIKKYPEVLLANMGKQSIENNKSVLQNNTITTAPCIIACPAHVDVPRYIGNVVNGQYNNALQTLLEKYPFPGSCGRVCTRPCEAACQRKEVDSAVAILDIKRFIADNQSHFLPHWLEKNIPKIEQKERVAIIGAGPSGLSCAYHLRLQGYQVDIYEKESTPGGMANIGIPSYRLPKNILYKESNLVQQLGANINYNIALGKDISLNQLKAQGYDAIYVAVGAAKGTSARLENEDCVKFGYQIGLDFLYDVYQFLENTTANNKKMVDVKGKVVILGGGNVAMDCVRSAIRLGAEEVHLVYRRTRNEMPADIEEIIAAEEEGVIFHFLTNPTGLILDENNKLTGMSMVKMELGEPDQSGRCRPIEIADSAYFLAADWFIPAIGQKIDTSSFTEGLDGRAIDLTSWGTIAINKQTYNSTSHAPYLFAGGDCSSGPTILIEAIRDGNQAAQHISQMLQGHVVTITQEEHLQQIAAKLQKLLPVSTLEKPCAKNRSHPDELDPKIRNSNFEEVSKGTDKQKILDEASRCLRCYSVYTALTQVSEGAK
jgi:formate dehydrogenase beta subunit